MASNWEIVVAEATTNPFDDPSFALADPDTEWNFAGDGAEDFTRDTTQSFFGFSSALADIGGGTWCGIFQSLTTTANAHYYSVRLRRAAAGTPTDAHLKFDIEGTPTSPDSFTLLRDGWWLAVLGLTPTAGAHNYGIFVYEDAMNLDAAQLEEKAYRTTYCDGEQPGCTWQGQRYTSKSDRSAQSRDGGRIYDIEDLSAYAEDFSGIGVPPVANVSLSYATIPGAEFIRTKIRDRVIILKLWVAGTDTSNLHSLRQTLITTIGPEAPINQQSFILRYSGATVPKQLRVRYEAGLELGAWRAFQETLVLRLWAEDPYWYADGQVGGVLDNNDALVHLGVVGRQSGVWTDCDTPSAGGQVYALVWGPDGCLYIGGNFENWDGTANADYIVKYDPVAGTYSALGTGMQGGAVWALAFDANNNLFAGGAFTGAGGVANTDQVAMWNGSAWVSLGGGAPNELVYALAADLRGNMYAGGAFTTIGGYSINYIARWDGLYWVDVGGASDIVWALALGIEGNMYAGGAFTTIGNRSAAKVGVFDGINWTALGDGVGDTVRSMAVASDGTLYLAGLFTEPHSYITMWSGSGYSALGDGYASAQINALAIGPDDRLLVGGVLIEAPPAQPSTGAGWWDPDSEGLAVWGAWRSKGADSYTDSKIDDTGQGRDLNEYGATVTWSAGAGWTITSMARRALVTGFVPDTDQTLQTVIVQFSNASSSGAAFLVGTKNSRGERMTIRLENSRPALWCANGTPYTYDAGALPTNIAIAGSRYYLDGANTGAVGGWNTSGPSGCPAMTIGGQNTNTGLEQGWTVQIKGVAIYTAQLTDAQVAKVEDQMQAW